MNTAPCSPTTPLSETVANNVALAGLCVGTVTVIGGLGLAMWVLGI